MTAVIPRYPSFVEPRSSERSAVVLTSLVVWFVWATCVRAVAAAEQPGPKVIRRIDLVHMTHTDIGFTDHPLVCRGQQVRYLDIAIDAMLATRDAPPEARFC